MPIVVLLMAFLCWILMGVIASLLLFLFGSWNSVFLLLAALALTVAVKLYPWKKE